MELRRASRAIRLRLLLLLLILGLPTFVLLDAVRGKERDVAEKPIPPEPENELPACCHDAKKNPLPLPTSMPKAEFEKKLYKFLDSREYDKLGWCADKGVRDTGPYINHRYYGTHPAVRIYYSPEVMEWLTTGRKGELPDGAMMVKEMFPPPAARYVGMSDEELDKTIEQLTENDRWSWTVMIKDSKGSYDGWFWAGPEYSQTVDAHTYPFDYPVSGFGLYCVRCHAVAKSDFTFAALRNIEGFPGEPVTFVDDNSWRHPPKDAKPSSHVQGRCNASNPEDCVTTPARVNPAFIEAYGKSNFEPKRGNVPCMPAETYDHLVPPAGKANTFLTSTQCMHCHGGLSGAFGPVMFIRTGEGPGEGYNISPYGEWRWSPMGLAGRDPVFHAQFAIELAYLKTRPDGPELTKAVSNVCFRCHGAMGKHQLDRDQMAKDGKPGDFRREFLEITDHKDPHYKYGALARDGISCMICHQLNVEPELSVEQYLNQHSTGRISFVKSDTLNGPYKDNEIAHKAMQNALGIKPQYNQHLDSSRLCAACHTVDIPIVDGAAPDKSHPASPEFPQFRHGIEQATYLEWLNSDFDDEIRTGNKQAKSCQNCHMPTTHHALDGPVETKVAIIQDQSYPEAEYTIPQDELLVRTRNDFGRHELLGLNVFLLEMFNQFDDILGVRKLEYMCESRRGLTDAIGNAVRMAREQTATVAIAPLEVKDDELLATVTVRNLSGHRFPSGVGFRRAFLEVVVSARQGGRLNEIWSSGRTNSLGMIVDDTGKVLQTEFFEKDKAGRPQYQPHYQEITAPYQVQIYEELTLDANESFTTSFLKRDEELKDNRLLPKGWSKEGPDPKQLHGEYLEATWPKGRALDDPDFTDGKGGDVVRYRVKLPGNIDPSTVQVTATLYYQSLPPYFLRNLFEGAPDDPAVQRLHYLCSHLDLSGTPIENWKLFITSATAEVSK
ncbi:hypothetical protein Pan216_36060 [Planctomycetes bacterium Pan216]|uniref:Cytochrome P460 domain-containing protein n=1 Tax=Kolteria novifilia TaxID=2527975 RepID=A0A518B6Z8_9BACT|nr:hypothetical protein Pan216_36060 [Planctomycetes bacterium Pan216]